MAPEFHVKGEFRPAYFPGVAEAQPFVSHLNLPAVADGLLKDAEFVPYAITNSKAFERCERIEKTCCKTAQAAVAKTRLHFLCSKCIEVQTEFSHSRPHCLDHSEVDHVIYKMGAFEKFC